MAKGNIILGYLRGSIGDITFFRAKGQQLSRARNRAPANPRTVLQMDQRAKMACAVKFYTQVGTNFFKYAFEGKKDNESYFNAFVKNNILLGGYIGKQASRVYDFPALGAWQISSGTLPEITAPFPQSVNGVVFSVGTVSGTPLTTISDLSKALIGSDSSRWREGDILTCLCYCATNYATLPTIYTDQGNRAYTAVWQIRLSTSNKETLPSIEFPLLDMSFDCQLDTNGLSFIGSSGSEYTNNLYCFGLIHSRNTANGLRVSSSTLVAPQFPELLSVVSSPSGNYYNAVIADWQASEEAILQGVLSTAVTGAVGWSTSPTGPWRNNVISLSVRGSEPTEEGFSVKYSSAAAAVSGESLIYARGSDGGSVVLVKTIYDDVVKVDCTLTLSKVNSSVDVYVDGVLAAHYYRVE